MILDKLSRRPTSQEGAGGHRVRNREATIHAVLESAQRLFASKGYDRTTLVDIAAETGLSPRGVILHFNSKADIAAELMLRDIRARAQGFKVEDNDSPAVAQILACFRWIAESDKRTFINFPALWAFSARWSEKVDALAEQAISDLLAPVRRAIDEGIASGELRRVDTIIACDILWSSYMSGLRRACVRGGRPADALPMVERALLLLRA